MADEIGQSDNAIAALRRVQVSALLGSRFAPPQPGKCLPWMPPTLLPLRGTWSITDITNGVRELGAKIPACRSNHALISAPAFPSRWREV